MNHLRNRPVDSKREKGGAHKPKDLINNLGYQLTPITESDIIFIENNKNNRNIQRDKIKLTAKTIELNGLNFPRNIVQCEDVKDRCRLSVAEAYTGKSAHVYQKDGYDYFTQEAVAYLENAGYKVPNKTERAQAVSVFDGDLKLLGQLLNYPQVGKIRASGERKDVKQSACLWGSLRDGHVSNTLWFTSNGSSFWAPTQAHDASSLIFLVDRDGENIIKISE